MNGEDAVGDHLRDGHPSLPRHDIAKFSREGSGSRDRDAACVRGLTSFAALA
jgi:hypothetical protein